MYYTVSFFRMPDKKKEVTPGNKQVVTENPDEIKFLGSVTIDDSGVNASYTLTAKAFRWCNNVCATANKVVVTRIS